MLLILAVILFALGYAYPLLWVAAALLVFGLVHYGRRGSGYRGHGDDVDYRDYRYYRDQQDRWDRRYSRQRRGRWNRQDRGDRERHG
ncbi:hypothetical protein ACFY04_39310 [Streptomyces sp. NPDC001549]|uniref:hypothetical protein n=1 Tax=Streptomyces sp. NPDC001549 TaxID=3364586 RepID=UPI0036ABAB23